MTRYGRRLASIAGGIFLLSAAAAPAQVCPPECPAPGEKITTKSKSGCFVEFGGFPAAENGFKIACKDGDSTCDFGTTPDQCDFPVVTCINNVDPRFPGCTPEGIGTISLSGKKPTTGQALQMTALNAAAGNLLLGDPNLNVCTEPVTITVPLKVKGNGKRKKGKFQITGSTQGLGGTKAKDKLKIDCLPGDKLPPLCPLNPAGGPNRLTLTVGAGADLDTGWTGISHNQGVVEGSKVFVCLQGCDQTTNGVCTGSGETDSGGKSGTINGKFFGSPLPLSTGGVPVCVVNEYRADISLGKFDMQNGEVNMLVPLLSKVHQGIKIDQPCPICRGPELVGAGGTCVGGPRTGQGCIVEGLTNFGNTSTQCLPDPANGIGNLLIDLPLTTESGHIDGDANTCQPPPNGSGGPCPCANQKQRNDCDSSCSEAQCPSGLEPGIDQKCCVKNGRGRGCFEGDIDTQGVRAVPMPLWPETTYPKTATGGSLATPFCIAATESLLVNNVAGLAGAGNVILPGPMTLDLTRCTGGDNDGQPCGSPDDCPGGGSCG